MLIEISNLTDLEKTKAGKRVSCSEITVQQKENNRKIDNSVLTISKAGFSFILLADFFLIPSFSMPDPDLQLYLLHIQFQWKDESLPVQHQR